MLQSHKNCNNYRPNSSSKHKQTRTEKQNSLNSHWSNSTLARCLNTSPAGKPPEEGSSRGQAAQVPTYCWRTRGRASADQWGQVGLQEPREPFWCPGPKPIRLEDPIWFGPGNAMQRVRHWWNSLRGKSQSLLQLQHFVTSWRVVVAYI